MSAAIPSPRSAAASSSLNGGGWIGAQYMRGSPWHLEYDLDEELPDRASLTRIRKRYGAGLSHSTPEPH